MKNLPFFIRKRGAQLAPLGWFIALSSQGNTWFKYTCEVAIFIFEASVKVSLEVEASCICHFEALRRAPYQAAEIGHLSFFVLTTTTTTTVSSRALMSNNRCNYSAAYKRKVFRAAELSIVQAGQDFGINKKKKCLAGLAAARDDNLGT